MIEGVKVKKIYSNFKLIIIILLINFLFGCSVKKVEKAEDLFSEAKSKKVEIANQANNNIINTVISETKINTKNKYNKNLCTDNEEVLFSFKTQNAAKTLSICVSKNQQDYIVYRFGTKKNIELEFPNDRNDSWSNFTYSYYLRGGGKANAGLDLNHLSFIRNGYEYQVYQEYSAEDGLINVGIRINEKATNRKIEIKGLSNSIIGNLITLRENKKIKVVQNSSEDSL